MRKHCIRKDIIGQINSLRHNFAQKKNRLFGKILSLEHTFEGLNLEIKVYRNRIFSPIVTLQLFLFQVMSADHSCREMVGQRLAELLKKGLDGCSSSTASYCTARKRLSLKWLMGLLRETGRNLHEESSKVWRRRPVKLIDGTTVSMPDTAANQKAYPQPKELKAGCGFPIVRIVGIISLGCGAVLDIAIGQYEGKGTGEHALLRKIIGSLKKTMWRWGIGIMPAIG